MFDKKYFFRLLWPVLIEQALNTTIGIVNTMMVSGIGMDAISAVSIVNSLNFIITNIFVSLATGATVVVATSIGAGNMDRANRTAVQSIVISVLTAAACGAALIIFGGPAIGFLFGDAEEQVKQYAGVYLVYSALSYPFLSAFSMASGVLRGSGNTRSPMRISILANAVNVVVGALCIYLLKWGVSGAGVALLLSRIASALLIGLILYHNDGVNIRKKAIKPEKAIIFPVLRIGVPTCVDGLVFNGGKLIVQIYITALGTAALAANGIATPITDLMNITGNSMSLVAVTIVGQSIGAGIYGKELRKTMKTLTGYTMLLLAGTILVMFPLMPLIVRLYSPPDDIKGMIYSVLYIVMAALPLLWPIGFVLPSCLRSTGDASFVTIVSVMSMWLVRVLGAWFTVRYTGWGLDGIWIFWCTDWLVRGIAFMIRTRYSPYINGKHLKEQPKNV